MNPLPLGTGYSAAVRLELHVANQVLELAEIGPDSLYLRTPITLPPCKAEIAMYIDGRSTIWQVDLPEGLSSLNPNAKLIRRNIGEYESLNPNVVADPVHLEFTTEELVELDAICEEFFSEIDHPNLNRNFSDHLQSEFARRCGRMIPPPILAAKIVARRPKAPIAVDTRQSRDSYFDLDDLCETVS